MSVWRGMARPARYAALAAGALPVFAFPAPNLEFLAWFGIVPGLLIIRAAPSLREAAMRGWWFGAGYMIAAIYWLAPDIGPAVLLISVVFGALWTGMAVSAWKALRPPVTAPRALAAMVVVPSFWLVTEWIRSWQGFGGPWALLGATQWRHPAVLALASVGGVWLVGFALVAANTGLAIVLMARRLPVRALGAAGAVVAITAGPAVFALAPPVHPQRFITVALVQPGIVHNPALRADASERLSAGLASRHPDLIVWGESSVAFDLRRAPRLLARLEALSAADGAQILVNQDAYVRGGKSKMSVLVGPKGISGTYTKTRLVPFGEYIPFRQALGWLAKISKAAAVNMVPGHGAHPMTVTIPHGRPLVIGPLICFESAFPDMSRVDTVRGAQLIVYQTSDSTFQHTWGPAQHASLGALRAAETGRPVVQAALTGDSVAYDARGRLLASMTTSQRGVLFVRIGLPSATGLTVFDQIGEVVPWTAVAVAVLAAAYAVIESPHPRRLARILLRGNERAVPSVSITESSPGHDGAPAVPDGGGGAASPPRAGR